MTHAQEGRGLWEHPCGVCLIVSAKKATMALTALSSLRRPSSDPQDLESTDASGPGVREGFSRGGLGEV